MSIYNQTGVKISQYQTAQVDSTIRPNKLALEHFLISYAPAYYGTSTINKNFKVPVNLLRNDFIGYVGIKNAKSDWRNTIKLWCGDWSSSDLPNSYICTWTKEDIEKYPNDFITDKHADEKGYDKIFIISNAPLPETEEASLDPNPNTKKIVTKDYVDSRFNGSPKVYCEDTTLRIRSYPCVYIFENESLLNIDITDTDENGNTLKDLIGDKCLDFIIRVPTFSLGYYEDPYRTDFTITHNGKGCRWGFKNELIMMLDRARQENVKDLWFRCYAEYINGEFTVNCTNGLNVLENEVITGAAGVVTEIDETYNGKEVPTEEAVVNYVHLHTDKDDIHVTQDDKDYWNSIQTSVENLTGCEFGVQGENSLKSLIELTRTELQNDINSKTDSITKNLNGETERAEGAEEALGGRIDQLTEDTTDSIAKISKDTTDSIAAVNERIDNLDSNKSSNGITIEQTDGKITSLGVQSATVNEDGTLKDVDNVITGTEVQKLITNVRTEFSKAGVNYKIETSLPKPASSQYKGWIYLIPKSTSVENNEYIEFVCVYKDENTWAWEQIGTTKADLTEYIKEDTFDEKIGELSKSIEDVNTAVSQIETKVEYNYDTLTGTTQKMNFKGKYVQLVTNDDGSIDLIFGPNINPPSFSSLTSPTTSSLYVYKPVNGSYTFPTNQTGNATYTYCSANNSTQTIYLNGNGVELSNGKAFTLTCTISRLGGEDIVLKVENIDGSKSSYTVEDDSKSIKIELSNIVKNTLENNPDGTPGFIRYKGKITITQSNFAQNGDWYTLTVSNGDTSKATVQIFAYKPVSNANVASFEECSFESSGTRTVSGISYHTSGNIKIKVENIAGTQQQVTSNKNRLKITCSDTNSNISIGTTSKTYTSDELELYSGAIDSDSAIFKMKDTLTSTVTTSNNAITKLNTTVTAALGQQSGFNSGSTETITTTGYIWSKPNNTTDSSLVSYFTEDGSYRKLGYIDESTMKLVLIGDGTYDKESKLSATNYDKQLLVQGGKVKHPKNDTTEEYKNLTGKRYLIRTFSFSGSDRVYTFNIKLGSGITNSFPSGVKMYIAKDTTSDIQELTAAKNKGHNGCAESDNPSNGTWTVAPAGKFEVFGGTTYYFIIELADNSTAELGTLTITK